jgi:hypothetical protein
MCLSLIEAESQMSSMVMDRLALVGAVPAVKWIEIATLFEGSEPLPLCPILRTDATMFSPFSAPSRGMAILILPGGPIRFQIGG